jgi:signal peptidase II
MNLQAQSAVIVAAVVVVDRITKIYIRNTFSFFDVHPVIPGFFNIVHTENPGAAFGMFSDSPSTWKSLLLIVVSLAVMSVIAVMLWKPRRVREPANKIVPLGLSLVFGGALGNLWDRLFRGTVTDFLQFFFGSYEFPAFNAADSAITIGAALLLFDLWRSQRPHGAHPAAEPGS